MIISLSGKLGTGKTTVNMIDAKVVAATVSGRGAKITTLELTMPKWLLAEFNTHRVISKSSASSRAIPTKRMMLNALNGFKPKPFTKAQPGMMANEPVTGIKASMAAMVWTIATYAAVAAVWILTKLSVSKQHANRLIEPFLYVKTVATSTEWGNFLGLRDHPAAQPEMQELAKKIRECLDTAVYAKTPWHLPYVTEEEAVATVLAGGSVKELVYYSAARCARVSYERHGGGNPDLKSDLKTAERLIIDKHQSPFEHQAKASPYPKSKSKNFTGWIQARELIETKEPPFET